MAIVDILQRINVDEKEKKILYKDHLKHHNSNRC